MASELIYFHKGLATDARSCLQEKGFLKVTQNILMEIEGKQTLRPLFAPINTIAINSIHSMKYWRSMLLAGNGSNLSVLKSGTVFTPLTTGSGNPWQFKVYKDFILGADGTNLVLVDENMNTYPAQVENPLTAPMGAKGSALAGGPNGVYRLYVSYFITWPNGHTYETGLSPIGTDVDVTDANPANGFHISWSAIPTCPYDELYGTAPTIYRNLYRGPGSTGTLTEIYFVDTILDNATPTYDDIISDTALEISFAVSTILYVPPRIPKYIAWHYGRLYMIDSQFQNRLYYTEPAMGNTAEANEMLMPLAITELNWDDIRVPGFDDVNPQGLLSWGSYLYIPLKNTWIRKQGDDPANWAFRKTYSAEGIGAPYSIDTTSEGIIGVTDPENSEPGIAVFNGQYCKIITSPRLDELFKNGIDLDQIALCRGVVAGRHYFLLYPSIGSGGTLDSMLAIDMRRPEIRVSNWTGLNGNSLECDKQGKNFFIGGSDGFVRQPGSAGAAATISIETHDLMGGNPEFSNQIKTWKELKYALNTGTESVTLQVYIDDILMKFPDGTTSKTLSGSSEAVQVLRSLPQDWYGYRMRIVLSGSISETFELYSPWKLDFEVKV